jgi:hypothetical protein
MFGVVHNMTLSFGGESMIFKVLSFYISRGKEARA